MLWRWNYANKWNIKFIIHIMLPRIGWINIWVVLRNLGPKMKQCWAKILIEPLLSKFPFLTFKRWVCSWQIRKVLSDCGAVTQTALPSDLSSTDEHNDRMCKLGYKYQMKYKIDNNYFLFRIWKSTKYWLESFYNIK